MRNPLIDHYDSLINEKNDPVHDSAPWKDYMNKWDRDRFIEDLQLSEDKSVLEVGVGTVRLAIRVAPNCGRFVGSWRDSRPGSVLCPVRPPSSTKPSTT